MGEGLREVAEQPPAHRIVLLGQQAQVVGRGRQPLEHRLGLGVAPGQLVDVAQPETAGQKGAFAGRQAIDLRLRRVTQQKAVDQKLALDRPYGRFHARIVDRQEAGHGHEQQAGVERLAAVILHEGVAPGVPTLLADLRVDGFACAPPAGQRAFQIELFGHGDGAVEGDPGHDLRMHEMPPGPTHLPDAVVGLAPDRLQEVDHHDDQGPGFDHPVGAHAMGGEDAADQFAIDVELALGMGLVADANRLRAGEPGQAVDLVFLKPALAVQAVHDLQVRRRSRGRAHQPVLPGLGLLAIAGGKQGIEAERRVADPAIAIVPVARSPDLLGQGGGRGGDDAARRRIGQQLQRDQRALDHVAMRALILRTPDPVFPEGLGRGQQGFRGAAIGRRHVRRIPDQIEGYGLSGADAEVGAGGEVLVDQGHGRDQANGVGTGDGAQAHRVGLHPGQQLAIVEAEGDGGVEIQGAAIAAHQADKLDGAVRARMRHEVDHGGRATAALEPGLQYGRTRAVAAADPGLGIAGAEPPGAVIVVAEQGGENGRRVEPRQAQPLDACVATDQRRAMGVADQPIVFDPPLAGLGRRFGQSLGLPGEVKAPERFTGTPNRRSTNR